MLIHQLRVEPEKLAYHWGVANVSESSAGILYVELSHEKYVRKR